MVKERMCLKSMCRVLHTWTAARRKRSAIYPELSHHRLAHVGGALCRAPGAVERSPPYVAKDEALIITPTGLWKVSVSGRTGAGNVGWQS